MFFTASASSPRLAAAARSLRPRRMAPTSVAFFSSFPVCSTPSSYRAIIGSRLFSSSSRFALALVRPGARAAPVFSSSTRTFTSSSLRAKESNVGAHESLGEGERRIFEKLSEAFEPSELQVMDVSGGCGDFYAITIVSKKFAGLTTIKQHRLVNEVLKDDIKGIHGLQLKTMAEQ